MEAVAALFCTGAILAGEIYWFVCVLGPAEQKGKRATSISGGSISSEKIQDKFKQYWSFFLRPTKDKDTVPDFIDTFYNLVTDIYAWGWGQSFHFGPSLSSLSHAYATRLHEQRVANLISTSLGQRIDDVGCSVGGTKHAIASHARARVVGVTINDYQVSRTCSHHHKARLNSLCDVFCGNFLKMPFEDESFNGAYSIEATCKRAIPCRVEK